MTVLEAPVEKVLSVLKELVVLKSEIIHWFWIIGVIVLRGDIAYDCIET